MEQANKVTLSATVDPGQKDKVTAIAQALTRLSLVPVSSSAALNFLLSHINMDMALDWWATQAAQAAHGGDSDHCGEVYDAVGRATGEHPVADRATAAGQ